MCSRVRDIHLNWHEPFIGKKSLEDLLFYACFGRGGRKETRGLSKFWNILIKKEISKPVQ